MLILAVYKSSEMKKALITGITGQDGAYLAKFLLDKNYEVFGLFRRSSTPNFWRLSYLNVYDKVHLISGDMTDLSSIMSAFKVSNPDEVYHLAAQSFVEASFESPIATAEITGVSVSRILETVKLMYPETKVYFAGTSEMFGSSFDGKALNENSRFEPMSPYAASKLYGYWMSGIYKKSYKLFVSSGILFNHESELRGLEFVTRKIVNEASKIYYGLSKKIRLGNIYSARDWGYAPEYVEAMYLMLQQKEADDYVIATGETHSVEEFLRYSFDYINMDYHEFLEVDRQLMRPLDVPVLKGDYSKAKKKLKWEPKTKFRDLVNLMMKEEMKKWDMYLRGERFPWDVPTFPHENVMLKSYNGMK